MTSLVNKIHKSSRRTNHYASCFVIICNTFRCLILLLCFCTSLNGKWFPAARRQDSQINNQHAITKHSYRILLVLLCLVHLISDTFCYLSTDMLHATLIVALFMFCHAFICVVVIAQVAFLLYEFDAYVQG